MLSQEQQQIIENSLWVVNTALQKLNIKDKDIEQDALLYMCKCIERFDPSKGIKWETYAYKNIFLYIKRHSAREKINANMYVYEDEIKNNKPQKIYCNQVYTKKEQLKNIYNTCNDTEKMILKLKVQGYTIQEMSEIMGKSYKIICNNIRSIKDKAKGISNGQEREL